MDNYGRDASYEDGFYSYENGVYDSPENGGVPEYERIIIKKDPAYRRRFIECVNERTVSRKRLNPAIVFILLLVFFPAGLGVMYFGTRWGVFSKIIITIFTLGIALAVYEILVYTGILTLPSLIGTVEYIISQISA